MTQTRSPHSVSPYPRMSYEDYLADPTIDPHTEWVDGEVIPMMSVSNTHAEVTQFLTQILGVFSDARQLGRVYAEPFQMKLDRGRAPDVMFIRTAHLDRLNRFFFDGPADLVVEVISDGAESIDRGEKFFEYEHAGVPEYWIIDPDREVAEFYVRDEKGVFRSANVPPDGVYRSPALDGMPLRVQWLWDRPPVIGILGALGLQ